MTTRPLPFLTLILAAPAFALEAPADDAPPPPPVAQDAARVPGIEFNDDENAAEPKAATAFLGVVSGEVPEILAAHLELKPGEGVVVRSMVPGGPAEKSGIALHDVIVRVADRPVGSPKEISERISEHKPGDKIAVDLVHKGKATKLEITLGVRPADLANAEPRALNALDLEGFPKDMADRIRGAIAGNIGGLDLQLGNGDAWVPKGMEDAVREMQNRMQGALGQGLVLPGEQGGATIRMNDGQGSVEVKSKEGSKEVTIRDQEGKVTWSGPWDTAQDKAAAPEQVRERIKILNLDNGQGLRLQLNGNGAGQPPEED